MKRASGFTALDETNAVNELFTYTTTRLEAAYISPDEVAPNPFHPRDDWDVEHEDLRRLANSMGMIGQKSPCTVTLVDPIRFPDLATQGLRYMLIDGHRRYAAARLEGLPLQVVIRTHSGDKPLGPVEALLHWLGVHSGQKRPTRFQILVCLARIRIGWEEETGEDFPGSVRILARLTGSSASTVSRLSRILDGPVEVCKAFADQLIPEKMALLILYEIDDLGEQVAMVRRIIAENKAWETSGSGRLTVEEVRQMIRAPQQQVQLLTSPLAAGTTSLVPIDVRPREVAELVRYSREIARIYGSLDRDKAMPLPREAHRYYSPFITPDFSDFLDRLEMSSTVRDERTVLDRTTKGGLG
jgi:ParB-like chromosome segregation protein Spo0J